MTVRDRCLSSLTRSSSGSDCPASFANRDEDTRSICFVDPLYLAQALRAEQRPVLICHQNPFTRPRQDIRQEPRPDLWPARALPRGPRAPCHSATSLMNEKLDPR